MTEYGSLYSVEDIPITPAHRTYSDAVRGQFEQPSAVYEEETRSIFLVTEEYTQDAYDWSVGIHSDSESDSNPDNNDVNRSEDLEIGALSSFAVVDVSGGSLPRDFGSPADSAWLLLRQNPEICDQNGVCPIEIEILLRNALSRQSDHPTMSKTDVIGCLCPDGKCKPLPPIGASSIKVVVNCLECEDDCPICLCPMEDEMGCITSCCHIFHRSCFFKIPEDPWGNWKRCPLCRTRLSAQSYDIISDRFNVWSSCNCCEHHKRRRPSKFCAGATDVEHFGKCSDPRARVVFELLFRLRECTPTCHCSCRSEMRRLCRLNIYRY
jgi:hypothetical protein